AALDPGAPAVIGGGEAWSYGELHLRAGRIARRLREIGVGPGMRVGLCLERSPDLVAGLLATLGVGGAYVTLDPAYPAERLAYLLADSGVAVVLTQSGFAERLPAGGPPALLLDREEELPAADDLVPAEGGPEDLLYIIYTSGSTGLPKGAGVYQRGFVNLLRWYVEELGVTAGDRFLVVTSPGFDLTQKNLFAPLLTGGLLVLADPGLYDPREIAALVERHRITRLNCTPSAFYPLIEEVGEAGLSSLASVILGGEPISPERLASWRRSGGLRAEVVNSYGPTECTDVVAFHRLPPPGEAGSGGPGGMPIGRPLPGFRLLTLDRDLQPAPIGVPGQLAVGGVGVGAGYLGRPDLTAAKFVPDPFADAPGGRLYWTGDLARTLPGGEIDFLGRVDDQVKVRGFRIELGEIEAALENEPGVRAAAVLAREDRPGDRRLVAYLALAAPGVLHDLRQALGRRLPAYMVPGAFVVLDDLPLSANGKVDRRALANRLPETEPAGAAKLAASEPGSPLEARLAEMWAELLGRERVGVQDDFFALGGHSLLATRLVSRVRRELGVELPLRAVFEAPTVAALAARLGPALPSQPGLVPVPREGDLPLSFAQERLWFLDQLDPGSASYNVAGAVRLAGRLSAAAMAAALSALALRQKTLRTTFPTGEDGPVQVIAPAAPRVLPRVDLTRLPAEPREATARALAHEEAARPFDLTAGPLMRVCLLGLASGAAGESEEHVLLLTLHHIIADGWSMGVLVHELAAFYEAALAGRPAALSPLPIQYADFALWQRSWLTGEELERQLAWWREHLAGAPAHLTLPADRPRPAVQSSRGGTVPVALPAGLAERLTALG
ncbi:MAG: hypothetical protein QOJ16_2265, partial [Acidobacteriota bacterium]|nr:hypothetical protein [Acidobacteriota bacterium]